MSEQLFSEEFLRRLERLALHSRRAMAGQLPGERRSPKRGQSVEFADFRPYTSGDDIRRIDWNAYARLERFFIKLFIEEEDLTVHLLIDTSQSMRWGDPDKLTYAVRSAGAVGYIALTGLDRLTVTALGIDNHRQNNHTAFTLSPIRGKKHALQLFRFLQTMLSHTENVDSQSVVQQARSYSTLSPKPGPLILFSDLMDDGWQQSLNILARRGFDVTILHIMSPDEVKPQINGDFKLIDSETNKAVEITADFEMLERYHQGLSRWQEEWHSFCGKRGMHYVSVDTTLPLEELLFAWLRNQGVLK